MLIIVLCLELVLTTELMPFPESSQPKYPLNLSSNVNK